MERFKPALVAPEGPPGAKEEAAPLPGNAAIDDDTNTNETTYCTILTTDAQAQSALTPAAQLEFHPLAAIFPMRSKAELQEMWIAIRAFGQRYAIVLYENKILDGRNRYLACVMGGVEPRFEVYTGDRPLDLVINLNAQRWHLTDSQRAAVAAKMAT
jgi:hypothetical protein